MIDINTDFGVRIVAAYDDLLKDFHKCYCDVFRDSYGESDLFTYNDFFNFIQTRKETTIPFLGYIDNKPAVFRYIRYDRESGISYCPWGGIIKEYRGQGIYPKFCTETEVILREYNQLVTINEVENPNVVKERDIAIARIKMFISKLNFTFVSDEGLPYVRNGWGAQNDEVPNKLKVDYDYILGFKALDNSYTNRVLKDNKILKSEYLKLYLAIRDFEFDYKREDYMNLPATREFLSNLEKYKDVYINLVDINDYKEITQP